MAPSARPGRHRGDSRALARVPAGGLVLGAIASVQFGSSLAATLFARVGAGGTVFLRLAFAMVILAALLRPRIRARSREQLALACVFGLVLAAMNLSFYEALARIPLGIAVSVEFVGPLAVALAGSRRPRDLIWIVLAVAGIVLLTRASGHPLNGFGLALALAAGCFWAAYILVNARVGRAFEDSSGLALAMCVAAVAMAPVGIASGGGAAAAPGAAGAGRGGWGAVVGDPVLVRAGGAAADRGADVRGAHEPRAGDGGAGGLPRARPEPRRARAAGDRVRGRGLAGRLAFGERAGARAVSAAQAGETSSSTVDCAGTSAEIAPVLVCEGAAPEVLQAVGRARGQRERPALVAMRSGEPPRFRSASARVPPASGLTHTWPWPLEESSVPWRAAGS